MVLYLWLSKMVLLILQLYRSEYLTEALWLHNITHRSCWLNIHCQGSWVSSWLSRCRLSWLTWLHRMVMIKVGSFQNFSNITKSLKIVIPTLVCKLLETPINVYNQHFFSILFKKYLLSFSSVLLFDLGYIYRIRNRCLNSIWMPPFDIK